MTTTAKLALQRYAPIACFAAVATAAGSPTVVACGDGQAAVVPSPRVGDDEAGVDAAPIDSGGEDAAGIAAIGARLLGAGSGAACALGAIPGPLRCWGADKTSAQAIAAGSSFSSVSAGAFGICAVRADGALFCFDSNASPQPFAPKQQSGGPFHSVSVGDAHACTIAENGALGCWGANDFGQLGVETDAAPTGGPTTVGSDTDWLVVSAGVVHTCALRKSGALSCWGEGAHGELGDGTYVSGTTPHVVGDTWRDVVAGNGTTCGVRKDGALLCWGAMTSAATPTSIDASTNWVRVALGDGHGCALKATGALACWGTNDAGQLGDGTQTARSTPMAVDGATDWVDVAAGASFSCGAKADGRAFCWGRNSQGQLGQGTGVHLAPTPVGGAGEWADVSAALGRTCAVKKNGGLYCWGARSDGSGLAEYQSPTAVGTQTTWATVTTSLETTCARRNDGSTYCWGFDSSGQVGSGPGDVGHLVAAPKAIGLGTTLVAVGVEHACALDAAEMLYCWGVASPALGFAASGPVVPSPTQVDATTKWLAVALTSRSSCWIEAAGVLDCAGLDYEPPIANVNEDTTWTALAAAAGSAPERFYGLHGGSLWSWKPGVDPAPDPAFLEVMWQAIADHSSPAHLCGILGDGTAACYGDNASGEIGDGTTNAASHIVTVGSATDWQELSVGTHHTCGIRGGGSLYCWGDNTWGQIGDGTAWRTTPVLVK